jgi:hypothetical protein
MGRDVVGGGNGLLPICLIRGAVPLFFVTFVRNGAGWFDRPTVVAVVAPFVAAEVGVTALFCVVRGASDNDGGIGRAPICHQTINTNKATEQ